MHLREKKPGCTVFDGIKTTDKSICEESVKIYFMPETEEILFNQIRFGVDSCSVLNV